MKQSTKKRKLKMVQDNICFNLHDIHDVDCQKKSCKNWVSYKDGKNCVIIASKAGPKTLQEIGSIYNLTRMRICQIEKSIYQKVKNLIQD